MWKLLTVLGLALVLAVGAAGAQEDDDCSAQAYRDLLDLYRNRITEETADFVVSRLTAEIAQRRSECAGLAFAGDEGRIIRPFELPAGMYVVQAEFELHGMAEMEPITEECSSAFRLTYLSTGSSRGGTDESFLNLEQACTIIVDVDTRGKWQLIFEAL